MDPITYASAGVNIERAESFVTRLKKQSARAGHDSLWRAAGGYAAVYPMTDDKAVAVTTDGVGTKLLVANELKDHSTIGIDLVAMCANDLICVGAIPNLFLDYLAVGELQDGQADAIIDGVIIGCDQASMILAGGETAEMPGLYAPGHYDLAGFAVGSVTRKTLLTGEAIKPGQKVIGVASSGIHSNGLSLARKVIATDNPIYKDLLKPTFIYVKPVVEILEQLASKVVGIVHVTGGGWRNLFRLNKQVGFRIDNPLPVPAVLQAIAAKVAPEEMYKTFNMGMALCLIVESDEQKVIDSFQQRGFTAQVVGSVTDKKEELLLTRQNLLIRD